MPSDAVRWPPAHRPPNAEGAPRGRRAGARPRASPARPAHSARGAAVAPAHELERQQGGLLAGFAGFDDAADLAVGGARDLLDALGVAAGDADDVVGEPVGLAAAQAL